MRRISIICTAVSEVDFKYDHNNRGSSFGKLVSQIGTFWACAVADGSNRLRRKCDTMQTKS